MNIAVNASSRITVTTTVAVKISHNGAPGGTLIVIVVGPPVGLCG
jgi:hypothetical protein